jgi:hypothetical protein
VVFVSLGLGSVIASAVEVAPWLTTVTRNKEIVFLAVGAMLAFNYWFAVVRPRRLNCAPGEVCHVDSPAMRLNRRLFWTSVVIYLVAITFTYSATAWVRWQS